MFIIKAYAQGGSVGGMEGLKRMQNNMRSNGKSQAEINEALARAANTPGARFETTPNRRRGNQSTNAR